MDKPNSPDSVSIIKKQSEKKGITFLKVGLFEILFVAAVLLLFLGILNYFKVISLFQNQPQKLQTKTTQNKKVADNRQTAGTLIATGDINFKIKIGTQDLDFVINDKTVCEASSKVQEDVNSPVQDAIALIKCSDLKLYNSQEQVNVNYYLDDNNNKVLTRILLTSD